MSYLGRRLTTILSHLSSSPTINYSSSIIRSFSTAASSSASSSSSYPPLYSSVSSPRVVIIGGIAGGASFAARARRLSEKASITIIEKGPHVSVGTCGMPYRIGGEITDDNALLLQTPQSLAQRLALDVKVNSEAIAINREKRLISVNEAGNKTITDIPYDYLLLSPGSSPLIPPLANIDHYRIKTLRTIDDTQKIRSLINDNNNNRIIVIGAGFIGLEVAEQIAKINGKVVTIIELKDQILPQLDGDMVIPLQQELIKNKVQLKLGTKSGLKAIHTNKNNNNGPLEIELNNGERLIGDVVILALGVRPETLIAKKAGLSLSPSGHIIVDDYARTNDNRIYAVGDAVMMKDGIFEKELTPCALGGPANRQARLAADHLFLMAENNNNNNNNPSSSNIGPNGDLSFPPLPYPGSLCTSIVRIFDYVAAISGWSSQRLISAKKSFRTTIVSGFDHASYYPGAKQLLVKLLWDPENGRLLGGQVVGIDGAGVDKRIDVIATALRTKMTIEEMQHLELAYAPPFNGAKDVLNLAAFTATNQWKGLLSAASSIKEAQAIAKEKNPNKKPIIIDVRDKDIVDFHPLSSELEAKTISLDALRGYLSSKNKSSEISNDTPVITICSRGKTSYFASRILRHAGIKNVISLMGGTGHHPSILKQSPTSSTTTTNNNTASISSSSSSTASIPPVPSSSIPPLTLDCSGMSCPGPLLRLKESASKLIAGQSLHIRASDPGFINDLAAFANTQGLIIIKCENKKGIIEGIVMKPELNTPSINNNNNNNNTPNRGGAAIVVFSGNYDKVLAALVLATGSAAMGGPVTLFFTFFGLSALRKPGSSAIIKNFSSKGLLDSLFGTMLPDNFNAMPLSDFNFGGAGPIMIKKIMNDKQLPTVASLFNEAKKLNIRLVACTMSMDAMGIKKEELLDGVELGGVADYIAASRNADLKLFI